MGKIIDLTGKSFGRLKVIKKTRENNRTKWECLCLCGNISYVRTEPLIKNKVFSCGCSKREYKDLSGKKFNRLKVIKEYKYIKGVDRIWECKCDCGNSNSLFVKGASLKSGNTKSCGCFKKEKNKVSHTIHGKSYTRVYSIFGKMKARCYNENNERYKDYGGRGINICDEWLNDFECFYNWSFKNGYSEYLTIDRIDNNKGYFPENCKWSNNKEQTNNKRNNRYISYNNTTMRLIEWCEKLNIKYSTLSMRLKRGWTIEKALKK